MNIRKVEMYLIEVFRPTTFGDSWSFPKPTETLGEYHVRMAKAMFGATIVVYALGFTSMWFDSVDDFLSFNVTDNVNMTFFISALMLIFLALPLSLMVVRLRVSKIKKNNEAAWIFTICFFAVKMGMAFFAIYFVTTFVLKQNFDLNQVFYEILGLFLISMCLSGCYLNLLKMYLLRKYCPYLINYRGGNIRRPGESQDEDIED